MNILKMALVPAIMTIGMASAADAAKVSFVYEGIKGLSTVGAQAVGSFEIDDTELTKLNGGGYTGRARFSTIKNLTMKVTGARWGNGTFTSADFNGITFYSPAKLDLSKELVGQRISDDYFFGQPHSGTLAGDLTFNPVAHPVASENAPSAARTFTLLAYGGFDYLQLRSLRISTDAVSAVPEPANWAMMIAGFGMIGGTARRRRNMVTTRTRFA